MNRIIPPIRFQDQGPAVANLQEALLFIVEKRQLTPGNLTLAQWQQNTASERAVQSFGPSTRRLFAGVLTALSLPNADYVDEPTAERLNQILETLGAFLPSLPPPSDGFPLTLGSRGPNVADLQRNLQQLGYSISLRESAAELFGDTTLRAVGTFLQSHGLEPNGTIDRALAAQIRAEASVNRNEPQVVLGVVRRSDSTAVERAIVRAFDADFRSEQLLGEDISDAEGRYSIAYSAEQFARIEKLTADLQVRAFDPAGQQVLAESPIMFNAPREAVVDLLVEEGARTRSEYERHMAVLGQLAPNVSPADFAVEDRRFLIGESGIGARVLAFLCVAHKHSRVTEVPSPAFYGLFRQGLPTNLIAVLLKPRRLHRMALERSIKDSIIPAQLASDLDSILDLLETARANHALDDSSAANLPWSQLLRTSGVPSESLQKFLDLYLKHPGRIDDFWESLRNNNELDQTQVEALRFTLQLASLTRNSLPLVTLLRNQATTLKDIVRLETSDWIALISTAHSGGTPLPPDLPGQTDEERIAAYANEILGLLQDALPMDYVRKGVDQDTALPAQRRSDLLRFLDNAAQFDLLDMTVDGFVSANPTVLEGVQDREGTTTALKRVQRIFRLTQRYGSTKTLLSKGWDSALLIAETPFSTFLESVGTDLGGPDNTTKYYKKAQQTSALSASVYGSIYQFQHDLWPGVLGKPKAPTNEVANWKQLFGSVDFCECKHCRSVYGPAAYFVDLLQFLRRDGAPFTALMKRRPDLEHLKLTCENTNTPLPNVDLANEIMEFFVVNGSFEKITDANEKEEKAKALAKDTGTATAEELSVNPKFVDENAYAELLSAVFSFRLPFNRAVETARVYLEHLGSSLHEVMSVFQNTADPSQKNPDDQSLARESLKITSEEFAIITGQSTATGREFFGYVDEEVVHKNLEGTSVTESWRANLARVPEFLRRTGVSFSDVVDLLKTRFINPVQTEPFPDETLVLFSPNAVAPDCDLNQTWIQRLDIDHENLDATGLDEAAWIRLHRFLRLWNKLGWTQQELDRAVIALGGGNIEASLIENLARVAWLRSDLKQPVIQLLTFWSPIDTFGDDSLYAKLFQNRAIITTPEDPAFKLNVEGTELADTSGLISKHTTTLQAALRINAEELTLLREAIGLATDTATLNLANISLLYRHALLARSLKLKMRDFLPLKVMAGADPFTDPAATVTFVEKAHRVKESPFKVTELNYLFRHISELGKGVAPAEDATLILLQSLQKDLLEIVSETQPVPDPTSEMLRSKLALVLVATAADVANGLSQATVVDLAMEIIDGVPSAEVPPSLTPAEQEQFIDEHFAEFIDPTAAKATLLPSPSPEDEQTKQARRSFVMEPLLTHLRDVLSRSVVKQTLTDALPLEAMLVQFLLEELLVARSDPNQKAIADFLALSQDVNAADRLPDFFRIHKIALLLNRFTATRKEPSYIASHSADFGNFDLNGMPLDRNDALAVDNNSVSLFAQWEHLNDYFSLRDRLPQADLTLLDALAAPSPGEARSTLSKLTGWDSDDVEFLSSNEGIGVPDETLRSAVGPRRLYSAFSLSRKTGISVQQLRQWAQEPLTAAVAQDIINSVKAKYDNEQWLTTAKSLNDELREKRKLALIAYLLAHEQIVDEGITNANELYEYFLIDVNVDPCLMTSRVKQAISSVQLFIQRSLLNLEKDSKLSPQSAHRWSWMKNYRLWEANRKVFLYPENWIEPNLRDDKSVFFKELENELLQNDLTDENVEQALMSYLEKLDDVGWLEACGIHHEKDTTDRISRVHIFARTPNPPHRYFYRRYDANLNRWSAWETVPVDIEGDHLIPVVWNRRLHLFWPVFVEKPDMSKTRTYLPEGLDPLTRWEIKMEWSEYRQGRWTPKQVSARAISSSIQVYGPEKTSFQEVVEAQGEIKKVAFWHVWDTWFYLPKGSEHYFRATPDAEGLVIKCNRRYDTQADFWIRVNGISGSYNVVQQPNNHGFEGHEWLGSFEFTGCRGRADIVEPGPVTIGLPEVDPIREPEDTFNTEMAFESTFNAADLTLQDSKTTAILRDIDTPFRFLPPQELSDLSKRFYPFVFQDTKRAYFVMPTLDDPRPIRRAITSPLLDLKVDIDDVIISEIPLPVNGDTGPTIFQKSLSPFTTFDEANGHFPTTRLIKGSSGSALVVEDQRMTSGLVTVRELGKPLMKKSSKGVGSGKVFDEVLTSAARIAAEVLFLKFHIFFHPHVCPFIKTLNHLGVPGLLTLGSQELKNDPANDTLFDNIYDPAPIVHDDHPKENVDFRSEGAYSLYNWELFFHAPLLIADWLSRNLRFEEALKWFHYIFDPTNSSSDDVPARFWRFLPFHENDENGRIEELLKTLNQGTASEKKKLVQAVEEWRDNPFKPHLIARRRIIAYQKTVVMKYLENLINWGDQLFARDTLESINEATQLYVLAYNLLGRRPEQIPPRLKPKDQSYFDLKPHLDAFSNAMIELENAFPFTSSEEVLSSGEDTGAENLGTTTAFYFCIPPNDKLLSYWDTVEDRLFKIRHCMNIEGVVRQLPLFEPPIDPALLVKAAAAGLDLSSVLAESQAPLTPYRFQILVQRASELCAEVKSLGQALLSTLEKKDAEALSALRAGQETSVLEAARKTKQDQIQEARRQLDALQNTRKVIEARQISYQQRLAQALNREEQTQLEKLYVAHSKQSQAATLELGAKALSLIPTIASGGAGSMGSPLTSVSFGGPHLAFAAQAFAHMYSAEAANATYEATANAIRGGHARRSEEWNLQLTLATRELVQIDKQIAAAEIRIAIAENDLSTHDKQIDNSRTVEEFLRNKYTNEDLYGWMLSQISAVYFQSYKLAYDLAKRAERAFRFDRGLTDSSFIQFGYWDSFTKGMLAGEKLLLDIKRMDIAYLEQNRREQEITKHLSLLLHDPLSLIELKETGRCEFEVSEASFDADIQGSHMRRIKSVSLTIPCVVGPYTSINCKLTLLSNKARIKNTPATPYPENQEEDDERFASNFVAMQSIVTSHAQNDSGMFELNFRDERYLPFEGAGAISRWRIELTQDKELRQFDYDTISDVVLHLKYTARDGGGLLKAAATEALKASIAESEGTPLARFFSARHEFPSAWYRFLKPLDSEPNHVLTLDLMRDRFPFQFRGRQLALLEMELFLKFKGDVLHGSGELLPAFVRSPQTDSTVQTTSLPGGMLSSLPNQYAGLPHLPGITFDEDVFGKWQLEIQKSNVQALLPSLKRIVSGSNTAEQPLNDLVDALEDVYVVCHYDVGDPVG
jgi:peptidoglycan hydrolase-like protein with peptidoglycan-binding domain